MSLFGQILDGYQVQEWVLEHLQRWAPTYFAELERQRDLSQGSIPPIRSWVTTPREPERWEEDQLPAVLCVNARLQQEPEEDGDGQVGARWLIGLGVIASAAHEEQADRLAKLQFAALRAIMLQHPSLSGKAEGAEWISESYDMLTTASRMLGTGFGLFAVGIAGVTDRMAGVAEPLADPYDPPGEAEFETVDRPEVVRS